MSGDGRVDEVAAQTPQARKGPVLVGAGEPAITDDIGDQDRRELAGLAHRAPLGVAKLAQIPARVCLFWTGSTAHVRIPSVPGTNRELPLWVDLTRSPHRLAYDRYLRNPAVPTGGDVLVFVQEPPHSPYFSQSLFDIEGIGAR